MTDKGQVYLEGRWKSQKEYYSKKSNENKTAYERIQVLIIIISLSIPVIVAVGAPNYFSAILGFLIAVITGYEGLKKPGDRWRAYRLASEALKREKALYESGAGPYRRTETPDLLFAERCENIIAAEVGTYFPESENSKDGD